MRWIYDERIWLKEWKKSWTSTKLKRAREGPSKVEETFWNGEEYAENKRYKIRKWWEDCWARFLSLFREHNLQRLQSKQEMKQQQRMAILLKKMISKETMYAQNCWCVAELLAKDCEKAWTLRGWEDTMQKRYEWLEYVKTKDEKEKMEEMHQRKVEKMIKSAEGSAGSVHKITKSTMWRRSEEEDARRLDRCEAKRKEWGKNWKCDEEIQNMQNKPWRNDELKECEEALPRLKEGDLDKASRLYSAKTGVGCDGFQPKGPFALDKRNERRKCRVLGEGGTKW